MRFATALAGLALSALLVPSAARAEEPPPPAAAAADEPAAEAHPPPSTRWKLIAGGVAVTALGWAPAYLCATQWPDVPGSSEMKIPVAGPWISLAKNDCAPDDPDCGFVLYMRGFLLVIDGLMQAGGVGLIGEGVLMTTASPAPSPRAKKTALVVRPVPVVTGASTGVGVVGAF